MAGAAGAAAGPASSARSPLRPALAGFRLGAPGAGRRRRRRPADLGGGGTAEAAPPPGPGRWAPSRCPRAATLSSRARSTPNKGRRARAGRGEAAVPARAVPGRVSRERTQPRPAPPPPTPRSALPPAGPLRPADQRAGPGFPGGLAAAGLRPGGAGGGQRCLAASPARRARRLCSLRGLQRCSPARGLEARRGQSAFSSRRCCTRGQDKKPGRSAWEESRVQEVTETSPLGSPLWPSPASCPGG